MPPATKKRKTVGRRTQNWLTVRTDALGFSPDIFFPDSLVGFRRRVIDERQENMSAWPNLWRTNKKSPIGVQQLFIKVERGGSTCFCQLGSFSCVSNVVATDTPATLVLPAKGVGEGDRPTAWDHHARVGVCQYLVVS